MSAADILAAFTEHANHVEDHGDEPLPDHLARAEREAQAFAEDVEHKAVGWQVRCDRHGPLAERGALSLVPLALDLVRMRHSAACAVYVAALVPVDVPSDGGAQ